MPTIFVGGSLFFRGGYLVRNLRPRHQTASKHRDAKGRAERIEEHANAHDTARLDEESEYLIRVARGPRPRPIASGVQAENVNVAMIFLLMSLGLPGQSLVDPAESR